jgi:hypothetical protein
MATPADQRMLELLGRWLESLELHARYSSLDDDSYWKIQPWAEHQRPSRWIIDLAKQKTLALRAQVQQRIKSNDAQFSDSLELMTFLANLVGSEHIERFIPVAEARNERALTPTGAAPADDEAPDGQEGQESDAPAHTAAHVAHGSAPDAATATREMPKFLTPKRTVPAPVSTPQVTRNERKTAAVTKAAPKAPNKPPPKKVAPPPERTGPSDAAREQVIADAARLVQWGRKWFELPELIARMADRPTLPEVRRILKENKAAIEKKAGVG